jgi:L-asparagine transporter-like permease
VRATAVLALLASLFALVGTFQQVVALFICPALTFIALAASALLVVRRRETCAEAFRAPGYPLTTSLFVLLVTTVVFMIAANRPLEALTGFGLVLLGLPAHALLRLRRRHMPATATGVDP